MGFYCSWRGTWNKALSDTWCNIKFSFCFSSKYKATWKENLVVNQMSLRAFFTRTPSVLLALQSSASNRDHPTKFLISFRLFFRQLSDVFSLHLANQDARIVRCGVVNCRRANMVLDNSASSSSCILICQFNRKPPESCHKVVKN